MVKDLHLEPWEKKPFWQRQKYLWRHHFPMMSFYPVFLVISPIWAWWLYKRCNDPESKYHSHQRYKRSYVVLRHDDPRAEKLEDYGSRDPMYTIRFY